MLTSQHRACDAQRVRGEEGVHYLKQMGSELLGHVIEGPYPARLSPGVAQTCKRTKALVRAGSGAGPTLPPWRDALPATRPLSPLLSRGEDQSATRGLRRWERPSPFYTHA